MLFYNVPIISENVHIALWLFIVINLPNDRFSDKSKVDFPPAKVSEYIKVRNLM